MKKLILLALIFVSLGFDSSPKESAFQAGEWIKFRIHYGLINAGFATLEVQEAVKNNKKVFHAIGKGYTVGMSRFFFKVNDNYESYFDKETGKPYQYVRKIDEGGYTKDQEGFFNQATNKILVKDYKNKTENSFQVTENVQDIISAFFYLRNHPDIDKLKVEKNRTAKQSELKDELGKVDSNRKHYNNLFKMHQHLQNAKNVLINVMNQQQEFQL